MNLEQMGYVMFAQQGIHGTIQRQIVEWLIATLTTEELERMEYVKLAWQGINGTLTIHLVK